MSSSPQLIRLVYASRANFKVADTGNIEPALGTILLQSRRNNPRISITGILQYGDGNFLQCLEGERDVVNQLYNKIAQDERHSGVQVLSAGNVDARCFPSWSMKYIPLDDKVKQLLHKHGLDQFDPYQFSTALVDELLTLGMAAKDPSDEIDRDQARGTENMPAKRPLWKRLFGRS